MKTSSLKHTAHCTTFAMFVAITQIVQYAGFTEPEVHPIVDYGYVLTIAFYFIQLMPLLSLPYILQNALGLVAFNAFEDKVVLKCAPQMAPFICFRVVTRGNFPAVVRYNVERNRNLCIEAGLKHFCLEVVTDKSVEVPQSLYTKEVVVPTSYRTSSGALYKGRALQYCLEHINNNLQDNDWIVHLDEETLLTRRAIHGILNFICEGKHQFGQGVISYANERIVNWWTTLMDSFRVAEDMGRMRWDLKVWHRPYTGWKGSFIVALVGAERKVTFDNGLESSLYEDNFFSMNAIVQGYTFGFIEGEMWEKSPFTIRDFIQQRNRWLKGGKVLLHSSQIPLRVRLMGLTGLYCIYLTPFSPLIALARKTFPLPGLWPVDATVLFFVCTSIYMFLFGVIKSYSIKRMGLPRFLFALLGLAVAVPCNVVLQLIVLFLTTFGKKQNFHIVDKDFERITKNETVNLV